MGLLFADTSSSGDFQAKSETALLHKLGCQACPLKEGPGRMPATGVARPLVYMLGISPIRGDLERSEHFSGDAGDMIYRWIPKKFKDKLRWNNIVNSFVPNHQAPNNTALECCRPRVIKDIEEAKPKAIFGFGNAPLYWVSGFHGIQHWRGRRMPVQVGTHVCWYYVFSDPAELLRFARDNGDDFGSEDERMFMFDMKRAFSEIDDLEKPVIHTPEIARANVECITDLRKIEAALRWASQQPEVGLDYETNGLRPYATGTKILTAGIGTLEKAYAFPIQHPGAKYTKQQTADVVDLWTRFLLRASCVKVVHNLAFELEWSGYHYGTEVIRARPWQDTATAASIVDERRGKQKPGPFSLEFLVQQYFGINLKKLSANLDRARLEFAPLDQVLMYQGMDAKYHFGLWRKLWAKIQQLGLELPYELAVRRVPTVVLSQLKGVPVDQVRVTFLGKKYGKKIDDALGVIDGLEVIHRFKQVKGREFNPQSNPDILYVFDDMLKRPEVRVVDKYTKVETRSADESVLNQIDHPLSSALIELRSASGTNSKYISALSCDVVKHPDTTLWPDGLLHAQFNTFFAETGRLSCEWPNLQNFPKRDAETKEVRSSIISPPGCFALAFDYGQIQARAIAMFTKDKRFCKSLWERYDIHFEWAERIAYEYPARVGGKKFLKDKKVMKTFRRDIKNQWTFPLFFGAKDTSVAGYLKMPVNVIRPLVREFWKQFAGVKTWQEQQMEFYWEHGYVETLAKRRRHGPMSTNQIYNSPVQGAEVEIVMDAMCRLSESGDPRLQPELQIHDDLTYLRVPEKDIDTIAEKVISTMLAVPFEWAHIVPITVEMSLGRNWADMEEIGNYSSDTWNK